jgi:hypothetical protein
MGNFQFSSNPNLKPGQVVTIVETPYTTYTELPKNVTYIGTKVKIIGSKDLICSRPNAPKVNVSMVQLPDGTYEVYPSNNLR